MTEQDNDDDDDDQNDDDDDQDDDPMTGPPLGWMTDDDRRRTEASVREYLDAPLPPAAPPQMLLCLWARVSSRKSRGWHAKKFLTFF